MNHGPPFRQAVEQRAHLARVAVAGVHLGDDALRVGDERANLRVLRVAQRDHLACEFALEHVTGDHQYLR